jgi:hypothetical protein
MRLIRISSVFEGVPEQVYWQIMTDTSQISIFRAQSHQLSVHPTTVATFGAHSDFTSRYL